MPRKTKAKGGPTPNAAKNAAVQPPRSPNVPAAAVPTGLPQGEHQDLVQSAQAVPVPDVGARLQQAIDSVNARPQGILGGGAMLAQPTASPDEPVQTGLPIGPGGGPETLTPAAQPAQIDDFNMAKYLPMLETLASRPNVSNATRNYVRLVRGTLPPDVTMQSVVGQPGAPGGVSR